MESSSATSTRLAGVVFKQVPKSTPSGGVRRTYAPTVSADLPTSTGPAEQQITRSADYVPWLGRTQTLVDSEAVTTTAFAVSDHVYLARDHPWAIALAEEPSGSHLSRTSFPPEVIYLTGLGDGAKVRVFPDALHTRFGLPAMRVQGLQAPGAPFVCPVVREPVALITARDGDLLVSVGQTLGMRTVSLPCGHGSVDGVAVAVDYNSLPGDCGSPVLSRRGIVGTHIGSGHPEPINFLWPVGEQPRTESQDFTVPPRAKLTLEAEATPPHSPDFAALSLESVIRPGVAFQTAPERGGGGGTGPARRGGGGQRRGSVSSRGSQRSGRSGRSARSGRSRQGGQRRRRPNRVPGGNGMGRYGPTLPNGAYGRGGREALVTEAGMGDGAPIVGSDNIQAGGILAASNGIVERYIDQLVSPWGSTPQRLPDDCIRPTSLAKLFANRTYTVGSSPGLFFAMHSKPSLYSSTAGLDQSQIEGQLSSGALTSPRLVPTYRYAPGCILQPLSFTTSLDDGSQLSGTPTVVGPWGDDYGTEQATLMSWVAASRTLAMAIRLRVVGLPTSTFLPAGKVYFGQFRGLNTDTPLTEQDWTTAERLGIAAHVSLDAVRQAGSKTWYVLPDGTDKFRLSSFFQPAPGLFRAGDIDSAESTDSNIRCFPAYVSPPTSGYPSLSRLVVPYGGTASNQDQVAADETYYIFVACFGLQAGTVIEVDYSMTLEYVPTQAAPPGIETAVQLRNSSAVDGIFGASAVLADARGVLLQSPGDKTIVRPSATVPVSAENLSSARAVREALYDGVRGLSGTTYLPRGRSPLTEGWFDWLSKGEIGGLKWDFTEPPNTGAGGAPAGARSARPASRHSARRRR